MTEVLKTVAWILEATTDEELEDRIVKYLYEQEWDFSDEGEFANHTDLDEITVSDVERNGNTVTGNACVGYVEVISTSCGDVELNNQKSCSFSFKIEDGEFEMGDISQNWDGGEFFDDF